MMVNSDVNDVRETQDSNFFYFCSNMVDTVKRDLRKRGDLGFPEISLIGDLGKTE